MHQEELKMMFSKYDLIFFFVQSTFLFSGGAGEPPVNYSIGLNPTYLNYFDLIDECGLQAPGTPVSFHTTVASIGEFPWVAKLIYVSPASTPTNVKLMFICGGALITTTYVLTAKHCIKPGIMGVSLGDYNSNTDVYCMGDLCSDPPQYVLMKRYIKHPTYDVGIVVLKEPVKFTLYVRPICLPWNNTVLLSETGIGQVAGWEARSISDGRREFTNLHTHMMSHTSKQDCRRRLNLTIKREQFCAGGYFDQDICKGIDGGPLVKYETIDGKRTHFVVGISSFGEGVCHAHQPVGFVNTSYILEWLFNVMEPVAEPPKTLFQHYFN